MKPQWAFVIMAIAVSLALADEKGLRSPPITFLTIDDYVRLVLNQSDRAMTAYNNYENSVFDYKISFRQLALPSLTVASEVSRNKTDVNSAVTRGESAQGSAALNQPLFLSGGRLSANYSESVSRSEDSTVIGHSYARPTYSASYAQPLFLFVGNPDWRSWKRTKLSFDIATDSYKREVQSIENEARAKYYDVLLKTAQLDVEKIKLESSRRAHGITKALLEAGRLAGIESTRSTLRLQQDIRRFKNAETVLQQSINDTLEFSSIPIGSEVRFTTKLGYEPFSLSLDLLIDYALQHRPDYIAAKKTLELAKLSVKEAREANNPSLSAVASVSRSEAGTGTPPDTITKSWTGGLSLSWPLFDSGITGLRARSAQNNLENEKVAFQGLERNIRTEVTNADLDLKRTEEQLGDLEDSRKQSHQSVSAVRVRYQNGRDRLIDVFDSEQQLRDLELEYLNIIIAAHSAKDRLALLIGAPLNEVRK